MGGVMVFAIEVLLGIIAAGTAFFSVILFMMASQNNVDNADPTLVGFMITSVLALGFLGLLLK
jgi:hypothetical protein